MTQPPLTLSAWLRYDLIERTLTRFSPIESVLEIGAGEGALGARLAARYDYTGVEPDPLACAKARERIEPSGGRVVCGALRRPRRAGCCAAGQSMPSRRAACRLAA